MVGRLNKLNISSRQNVYGNILVGFSFLTLTFLTVKTFAPDISSNAETNTASVEAGPYTMSISANSNVPINVVPTASQHLYTGNSMISYTNTCPYGFNVTMSADSEDTALSRIGVDDEVKTIPSIAEAARTLSDNSWGYSIDHGTSYNPIPALSNPENIINTFDSTTNATTLRLIYGVMVDNNLPSGKYSNNIVYTVSAKPQCLTYGVTWDLNDGTAASSVEYPTSLNFGQTVNLTTLTPTRNGYTFTGWSNGTTTFDGTETSANINPNSAPSITMTAQWERVVTMQTFDLNTMLLNVGDSMTIRDERDDNMYTVKRLADGKVWMTENLRIVGKTITSADSDVTSDFTIPASSVSGFIAQDTNNAYVDGTYGGYYTFYTATAGTGGTSLTSGNAPSSICPKGWRLPTGGSSGEFNALYGQYNSADLMMGVPNFTLSGYVGNGSVGNQGSYGVFWSSSVHGADSAYFLYLGSSNVNPAGYNNKRVGFSVRCMAMDTMQNFDKSTLSATGDEARLIDVRDKNMYTVKKLADGKVWMTENLRLVGKTITSEDSNVSSDFTIPASSTSGFSKQNVNNAYVDSTYGGYYTFHVATAGTGASLVSGNAPSDICPKGWRLPTGNSSGEFQALYNNYNSSALMRDVPGFVLSGYVDVDSKTVGNQGTVGYFWSSTIRDSNGAYFLYLGSSSVSPANNWYKYYGYSVRCVAI